MKKRSGKKTPIRSPRIEIDEHHYEIIRSGNIF
jgi:hypothetical protein